MTDNGKKDRINNAQEILDSGLKEVFTNQKLLEDFITVMSKFNFSAGDCLIVAKSLPNASHLAAFSEWNDSGFRIKKGEKSITLLDYEGENGKNLFDISQTNATILEKSERDISSLDKIRALLSNAEFPVASVSKPEFTHGQAAYFDSKSKVIFINRNASLEEIYPTLATELAHSDLFKALKNNYSREQCCTAAQLSGSVICKKNGVKANEITFTDNLKNCSPQAAKTVLDNVRLISDKMNNNIQYFYENGKSKHEFPKPPQRREKSDTQENKNEGKGEKNDSKKSIRSLLQEQKMKKNKNKYQPQHIKENNKAKGENTK